MIMAKENEQPDFKVTEQLAVLSRSEKGYTTELNRVSFHGHEAKLDLRRWRSNEPLKGITLTNEEACKLLEALQQLFQ